MALRVPMKLCRPKNRIEWWSAFVGALLVVAPAISFGSVALAELLQLRKPAWLLLGPIAATVPIIHLVLISRLPRFWRILLVPILAGSIVVIYQPRSSCGQDDAPIDPKQTSQAKIEVCNG